MMELQYRRPDGSYLAQVNGLPYHIIEGDPLFAEAQTNGADLPLEPVPEPAAITVDDYRTAIQGLVDQTAQARSYDSGITCASYVGSTNPIWAAEAAAFVAWRDAVWVYAFTALPKVQSGQRPQPSVAAFLDELPLIIWPQ